MKYLIVLLMLAGCSDEPMETPEPNWAEQRIIDRCHEFAIAVTSAEMLVAKVKCEAEKKEIESKRKAWMAKVPEHLKAHVVYPGPRESSYCMEYRMFKEPSDLAMAVRDCMQFLKESE